MTPEPTACWRTMSAVCERSSSCNWPYPVTRICTTAGETLAARPSSAEFSWTRTSGVCEDFSSVSFVGCVDPFGAGDCSADGWADFADDCWTNAFGMPRRDTNMRAIKEAQTRRKTDPSAKSENPDMETPLRIRQPAFNKLTCPQRSLADGLASSASRH